MTAGFRVPERIPKAITIKEILGTGSPNNEKKEASVNSGTSYRVKAKVYDLGFRAYAPRYRIFFILGSPPKGKPWLWKPAHTEDVSHGRGYSDSLGVWGLGGLGFRSLGFRL